MSALDRVVIINDRSLARGGATALALLAARLLAERGVPVTFIVGDDGEGFTPLRALGVECVALGGRALVERGRAGAFAAGLYNAPARAMLARWITRHDTPGTVYHVHGWSKILSPAVFGPLAGVASRTVLHAHDYFLACPNGGFMDYPRGEACARRPLSGACLATQCDKRGGAQKLWRTARHALRERLFDARVVDVLLIHPGMVPAFERSGFGRGRLHALRNPVTPFLRPGTARPWEKRSLVFVGRLEAEKGYRDAAEAARAAGMRVEFVGEGPGRAWLEREHPGVPVHGWLDRAAMAPILSRARAVLMPSRWPEPFGMVAVEALAAGLPLILPDRAMLAPEVARAGAGAVFATADVDALADAMGRMGDDAAVRAMSAAALQHASAMAETDDGWADALMRHYRTMLARVDAGVAPPIVETSRALA